MTVKNIALRQDLISLKKKFPCYTLQQIGNEYGITKERVRQILSSEGVDTTLYNPKKICQKCGGKKEKGQRKYCKKCADELQYIHIRCEKCHRLFRRSVHYVIYNNPEHMFCSNKCRGSYVKNSRHKSRFKNHPRANFVNALNAHKLSIHKIDYTTTNGWHSVFKYLSNNPVILLDNYSYPRNLRYALNYYSIKANVYCVEGKIYIDARLKVDGRLVNNGTN